MDSLSCNGWPQEAALRLLINSIDPAVAERPRQLVASGCAGRVADSEAAFEEIVAALKRLRHDETLLVSSGKAAGIRQSQKLSPRVVIDGTVAGNTSRFARPHGAFPPSPCSGSAWTYIGPQGLLHTAYEALGALARDRWNGELAGRLVVSGGLGAAGGAMARAATLHGAAFLGIEADAEKITRRIREGYCDYCVNGLDEALRILKVAVRQRQAASVGLVGNCAELIPELVQRGVLPDVLTDLSCMDDPLNGYIPAGFPPEAAARLRGQDAGEYLNRARESINLHVHGVIELAKMGAAAFEVGNGLGEMVREIRGTGAEPALQGLDQLLETLSAERCAPLLWVMLSGRREDLRKADDCLIEFFSEDTRPGAWLRIARRSVRSQGLPARVCWMRPEERIIACRRINEMVAAGALSAPAAFAINRTVPNEDVQALLGAFEESAALPETAPHLSGASWVAIDSAANADGETACICVYLADGSPEAGDALERAVGAA